MARVTKKLQLKNVLGSYVKVVEPGKNFDGTKLEYGMQIVIPKDHPQLEELKSAIVSVLKEAFPNLTPAQKAALKKGLRDNDEEGHSETFDYLKNTMFINAKRPESFGPVPCFDRAARPMVPTHETVFSGCLMNVSITIFSFNAPASKGVSCGLDGIQIVDNNRDRWDGQSNANNLFAPLPGAEEDSGFAAVAAEAETETAEDDIPW